MKTKYYEIDGRKFKLDQISAFMCALTIREDGYDSETKYIGQTAYERAMAEILSYSEIDQDDFADEEY